MELTTNYGYSHVSYEFKFHYVQMELILENTCMKPYGRGLNSTMFRWNIEIEKNEEKALELFKFHYVQMEQPGPVSPPRLYACLNSTIFRWNVCVECSCICDRCEFKFHYVQMELFNSFSIFSTVAV